MPDKNLEKQIYKSYLKAIENSVGSKIFNTLYAKNLTTKKVYDVMDDGDLSCAYFTSGLLTLFGLIDKPHATVTTVVNKLLEAGWEKKDEDKIKPGDIIVWKNFFDNKGKEHEHIGFALDAENAVSNSAKDKEIKKHDLTFGQNDDGKPRRKIKAIYRYSKF